MLLQKSKQGFRQVVALLHFYSPYLGTYEIL